MAGGGAVGGLAVPSHDGSTASPVTPARKSERVRATSVTRGSSGAYLDSPPADAHVTDLQHSAQPGIVLAPAEHVSFELHPCARNNGSDRCGHTELTGGRR